LNLISTNLDPPPGPPPVEEYAEAPVWLQRLFIIVYVLFCLTLGLLLIRLPWSDLWFQDGILARWPSVRNLLHHGFIRGAVSGLGLIDIWVGVMEIINYHDRHPAPRDKVSHEQQR
jgi:hypothetical protein